ncbi:hypothetical protein KAT24_02530 [Candidatus Pacearchaeota archaeon]|nr:hypothetical protein [Candidatus Pacearchaeota archaeon]
MEQTIRISNSVKQVLDKMKLFERETYNDVIEVLLEDYWELNEKTKKELEEAKMEKSVPHEEVLKRLNL